MFFELLNTPTAVLSVLVLAVVVNAFLFFGYYSERTASPPASSSPAPNERTQPKTNAEEATTPVTEKPS
jgi:hypothetical protein